VHDIITIKPGLHKQRKWKCKMLALIKTFLQNLQIYLFLCTVSLGLSSCYLELLVYTKLELSQISLERHKAVTAGRTVYSAMRAMEDAAVLNELEEEKR